MIQETQYRLLITLVRITHCVGAGVLEIHAGLETLWDIYNDEEIMVTRTRLLHEGKSVLVRQREMYFSKARC